MSGTSASATINLTVSVNDTELAALSAQFKTLQTSIYNMARTAGVAVKNIKEFATAKKTLDQKTDALKKMGDDAKKTSSNVSTLSKETKTAGAAAQSLAKDVKGADGVTYHWDKTLGQLVANQKKVDSTVDGVVNSYKPLDGEINNAYVATKKLSQMEAQYTVQQKARIESIKREDAAYKLLLKGLIASDAQMKKSAAGNKVQADYRKQIDGMVASLEKMNKVFGSSKAGKPFDDLLKTLQKIPASMKLTQAQMDRYAKAVKAVDDAQKKWLADQKAEEGIQAKLRTQISSMIASLSKMNATFAKSQQGKPYANLLRELQALPKDAKLSADQVKRFQQAVDAAKKSEQQWSADLQGSLRARLTFFEQQMDAILRASYRFKAVGGDLTRAAQGIFQGFQQVMGVFGQFDFNIRKAAASVGIFEGSVVAGQDGLTLLAQGAEKAAQEVKMIPLADVAQGFYYWGSMTGIVVDSMSKLNTLVTGHTAVLKAATMAQLDLQTALKGVYAVLTQFYAGDLTKTVDVTEKLFYTAQKTAAEFGDMIQSFKMVGPVAAGMGVKFEDVLTTIGQLSDLGIKGTMAGRAIRQIFIQLVKPSIIATKAINNAWAAFQNVFDKFDPYVKKQLADINTTGSYWDAVFPQGRYAGIQNQIKVLAAMTMNLNMQQRNGLLATMSTANSLPILMALVGKKIHEIQSGISRDTKATMDPHAYFEKSWKELSDSWLGVVGGMQRAWESLQVTIGTGIAEIAKPIIDTLTTIIGKINEWAQANPQIVEFFAKLAAVTGVILAIGGAVATVTGALLGLAGVTYVAVKSFFPNMKQLRAGMDDAAEAAGKLGTAVGDAAKVVDGAKASFLDMAKVGMRSFIVIAGVVIGLMDAIQRNALYISTRMDAISQAFTENSSKIGDAFRSIGDIIASFQKGIDEFFDLVVKRFADLILLIAQVVGAIGGLINALGPLKPILQGTAEVLGLLVAARVVAGLLGFIPIFNGIKAGAIAAGAGLKGMVVGARGAIGSMISLAQSEGIAATGGMVLGDVLASVKVAALSLWAALGPAIVFVGISMLIDYLGQTTQSLKDVKAQTDEVASAFGDLGSAAEEAARQQATAIEAAKIAALRNKVATEPAGRQGPPGRYGQSYKTTLTVESQNFLKDVDKQAQDIMTAWEVEVDSINNMWAVAGLKYHIDYSQFFSAMQNLAKVPGVQEYDAQGLVTDQFRLVAEEVAKVDPSDGIQAIGDAYLQIWKDAAARGIDLSNFTMTFEQFMQATGTSMADAIKNDQKTANDLAMKPVLESMQGASVSGWVALSQSMQTWSNGQTATVAEAIGEGWIGDDTVSAILQGMQQGADDLAQKIADSDVITPTLTGVTTALTNAMTAFISNSFADTLGSLSEMTQKLADDVANMNTSPAQIYADIFDQVMSNSGRTVGDLILSGKGAESFDAATLTALTNWAQTLVAKGYTPAQAIVDALAAKDSTSSSPSLSTAVADYLKTARDAFISAVTDGVNKSWKEARKTLEKRLLHPEKNSDLASIKKLLDQVTDPTILWGLTQKDDTVAFQMAYDAEFGTITSTVGGIQAAIKNGHTTEAHKDLEKFIGDLTTVDPAFFAAMTPEDRQNLLTFLQTTYGGKLPPDLFANLSTDIQAQLENAVGSINYAQVTKNIKGMGGPEAAGAPSAVVNPILAAIVPTPDQVAAAKTTTGNALEDVLSGAGVTGNAASTATANGVVDALITAVSSRGSDITNAGITIGNQFNSGLASFKNAIISTIQGIVSGVLTVLSSGTREAYQGGYSVGEAYIRGLNFALSGGPKQVTRYLNKIKPLLWDNSPPKIGPLKDIAKGGYSVGEAYAVNVAKGVGTAAKKTKTHLQGLYDQLAGAKRELQRRIAHNVPNDSGFWEREIAKEQAIIRGIWAKINAATGKGNNGGNGVGDPTGTGKGNHVGDPTKTGNDTRKTIQRAIDRIKNNMVSWQKQITDYRAKIADLMKGGLTPQERDRKTYIEQLIGDYQWRIGRGQKKLKQLMDELAHPKHTGKGTGTTDPKVGDTKGDATVTEVTKRIIEIHVDVESKDGSVDRAQQSNIRRGVMDALTLADLEHMVTVG